MREKKLEKKQTTPAINVIFSPKLYHMRTHLSFLPIVIIFSVTAASAQTKIPIDEAGKQIGETVTICSKVFGGRFVRNSQTKPTLLNLGGAYPNHLLTVLINFDDRKNFTGIPGADYTNKNVCV
jgi:hypothetical protein